MRALVAAAIAVTALCLPVSGGAITNGTLDGTKHPNVAALVGDFGEGPELICSATLVSSTVLVTDAHCVIDFIEQEVDAFVSFDSVFTSSSTLVPATIHINPGYRPAQSDPGDLAVLVVSATATSGVTPAALPTLNQLDSAHKGAQFTAVGYGNEEPTVGGGPPDFPFDGARRYAVGTLKNANRAWLRISQNDALGDGGTCFGDSGGTNFIGAGVNETNTVAALTNTGDVQCAATNVTYRLDTAAARAFLDDYVAVP